MATKLLRGRQRLGLPMKSVAGPTARVLDPLFLPVPTLPLETLDPKNLSAVLLTSKWLS